MIAFLPSFLTIITLLSSGSALTDAQKSAVQSFSKTWKPTDGALLIPGVLKSIVTDNENSFIYASCKQLKVPGNDFMHSCNVTKEIWPFKEGTYISTCENISISTYSDIQLFLSVKMYVLPQERILLGTLYTDSDEDVERPPDRKLRILDMSTCTIADVKAEDDGKFEFFFPALHKNGFEMFLASNKCDDKPPCQMWNSYDFEGKKVGSFKSFVRPVNLGYFEITPASHQSPDKGFFMFTFNLNRSEPNSPIYREVLYINSSSSGIIRKVLHEQSTIQTFTDPLRTTAFSNAHDRFSICWFEPTNLREVHCTQFDTIIQTLNVTLKLSKNVEWIAVHNMADGGLLVAIGDCENSDFDQTKLCRGFRVQKISSNGKKSMVLYIDGFQFLKVSLLPESTSYVIITENNENEYCFIWTSTPSVSSYYVNVNINYEKRCIPKIYIY